MQRLENLGFLGEVFRFLGYLKEFKGFETFIFLFLGFIVVSVYKEDLTYTT